jgi:hypothetical protein
MKVSEKKTFSISERLVQPTKVMLDETVFQKLFSVLIFTLYVMQQK